MKAILPLLLLPAFALSAGDPPTAVTVTEKNAFTFYKPFKRLTKDPHLVAPLTAMLCTTPRPELIEEEKAMTGPHHKAYIHIYCNPIAVDAVNQKLGAFATGAVIVKEKLAGDGSVSAVGGMIKREPGFDTEHGDWEYFYAAKVGGFSTGRLQNCVECHTHAKTTDYVYSVWEPYRY